MYHPRAVRTEQFKRARLLLSPFCTVFTALLLATFLVCAEAQAEDVNPTAAYKGDKTGNDYPILPLWLRLKHRPVGATIYQIDREAIGDRKPLLLIHGLRGEYRQHFRWDRAIKRFLDFPDFCRHYKIYLLRYDSTAALDSSLQAAKQALRNLSEKTGGKPLIVMCLSLGGTLMQQAMADPEIDELIQTVLTLGTPFHGSPLFCMDWLQYGIYKNLSYPWTRVDHSLAYRLYFRRNPNLLQALKWDNADKAIPEVGAFRSRLPFGPKGNLTVSGSAGTELLLVNDEGKINKGKFITYAGYLANPYMEPGIARHIERTILYPYTFVAVSVPAHLAREHPVLRMLNREISRVVPDQRVAEAAGSPFIYALNDGITPVNSALFLSSRAIRAVPLATESALPRLKGYIDVRLARLFKNIDHLTFVDGYRPRRGHRYLSDELNPGDGWRTIFDWMLSDIMQSDVYADKLAREGQGQPATR